MEEELVLNHRGKGWIATFALMAAALVLAPAALAAGLTVELAPVSDKAVLGQDDGVPLRFTVTNETDGTLAALYWHTPFRGFETDLFNVELNGRRVDYIDKMVMRLAPGPDDWLQIGPGESVSAVINLARSYDMSEPGTYTVEFDFPVEVRELEAQGHNGAAPGLTRVRSDVFLVSTMGAHKGDYEKGGPPSSGGCTTDQFAILETAKTTGGIWAGDADDYMDGVIDRPADAHYDAWFGAYDAGRWATVNTNFENIDAAMDESFNFVCVNCGRTMVAYVYKTLPYEINICPTFFNTSLLDADFRAGVILHETSHWNVAASTDDYAYGESNCLSLAATNPTAAIDNADNYHYFARFLP